MVIKIDEYSDVPIYMQIRNQIVMGISSGELKAGEQLPTVRALALEIGINTMTVSKTYQMLKSEGYIMTDRKNGARVRQQIEIGKDVLVGAGSVVVSNIPDHVKAFGNPCKVVE